MTADRLQGIVLRLADVMPTRYWLHFNYPRRDPWMMAIQVCGCPASGDFPSADGYLMQAMANKGFAWDQVARLWTIERTHEDGTPFGRLFETLDAEPDGVL